MMFTWEEFSNSDPELAKIGFSQLFQYEVGLAFLATVSDKRLPRLHPVCPVLSKGHLYVLVGPETPKRWDLQKNGNYALQSFPQPRPDSNEFYLRGKARMIENTELRNSIFADVKHIYKPDEIIFELFIERAMITTWVGWKTSDYHSIHQKWSCESQ